VVWSSPRVWGQSWEEGTAGASRKEPRCIVLMWAASRRLAAEEVRAASRVVG